MKCKKLSKAEKAWVAQLEACLQACPDRLALVTIGDSSLQVIDEHVRHLHDLDIHDGRARRNGLVLADIEGKPLVHGVSG